MIIVDFQADVPIGRSTREAVPDMRISLVSERAPGEGQPIHTLVWATGGDFDAFDEALAEDPTVTDPKVLAETGDRRLYRVVYTDEGMASTPYPVWTESDGQVLSAESTGRDFAARMRFPDREAIERVTSWFEERGLDIEVDGVYVEGDFDVVGLGPNLTEKQREAMLAAWRMGYFDVPRAIDLADLGDELGVSDTAASQRLRRAIDQIMRYHFGNSR